MPKSEFEAFVKAQIAPWEKRFSDLAAEHGRDKRLASLTPEDKERHLDAEKSFESMKRIVANLGVPADSIKDAESVRDLELLLRGYGGGAKAVKKDGEADLTTRFQEWQKEQAPPAPKLAPANGRGGAPAIPESVDELIKKDTRHMSGNQLREHGQKVDAALRAAGLMGR